MISLFRIFTLLCLCTRAYGQSGVTFSTQVAGSTTCATGASIGAASTTLFNKPTFIVPTTIINRQAFYISDTGNHVVKIYNITTGMVSYFAGSGATTGDTSDTTAATSSPLYSPMGLAVDANLNLYIAEYEGHRIRKVNKESGTISVIAGTGSIGTSSHGTVASSSTPINKPIGLGLDAIGNIYFAESGINMVKMLKLDPTKTTYTFVNIAGTASRGYSQPSSYYALSAKFDRPYDVYVDVFNSIAKNLYISDSNNHVIRKVVLDCNQNASLLGVISSYCAADSSSYYVSLFAGTPGATSASAAVALEDGYAATSTHLYWPSAFTGFGDSFFIGDTGNSRIRRYFISTVKGGKGVKNYANGTIWTVAGSGSCSVCSGVSGYSTSVCLDSPTAMVLTSKFGLVLDAGHGRLLSLTGAPTLSPTPFPSVKPTFAPSPKPTVVPSRSPTMTPTTAPTLNPTREPSQSPTAVPTLTPTQSPSREPSVNPTVSPTLSPTLEPTFLPTPVPGEPTFEPSTGPPTVTPSIAPTAAPTLTPTAAPTAEPTSIPSAVPTITPTSDPSGQPTAVPTLEPTSQPTAAPSDEPSSRPSAIPTAGPSPGPSPFVPTFQPTVSLQSNFHQFFAIQELTSLSKESSVHPSFELWNSSRALHEEVFKMSMVFAMVGTGVSADDISVNTVSNLVYSEEQKMREEDSPGVRVNYSVAFVNSFLRDERRRVSTEDDDYTVFENKMTKKAVDGYLYSQFDVIVATIIAATAAGASGSCEDTCSRLAKGLRYYAKMYSLSELVNITAEPATEFSDPVVLSALTRYPTSQVTGADLGDLSKGNFIAITSSVVGSLSLIGFVVGVAYFLYRRHQRHQAAYKKWIANYKNETEKSSFKEKALLERAISRFNKEESFTRASNVNTISNVIGRQELKHHNPLQMTGTRVRPNLKSTKQDSPTSDRPEGRAAGDVESATDPLHGGPGGDSASRHSPPTASDCKGLGDKIWDD